MNVVAVIPARGGSKGVPLKNLAEVGGMPLVARAVRACSEATRVDVVAVSTDDPRIAEVATEAGARTVTRPAELAGDLASSESAVLHALDVLTGDLGARPEVTVLVQCTSPFIDPADLDGAIARVVDGSADVVLSGTETHEFLWRPGEDGAEGVNHDVHHRPRRQDRGVEYRETGAFYVMRTAGLREGGHRFFGRIEVWPVPARHALEIDEPADLDLARSLAAAEDRGGATPIDVDAVVSDFDGVHTDDRVTVDQDGREAVTVSRSDGMGVARLRRAGVPLLILSTETNPVVAARAAKLGVPCVHGVEDKVTAMEKWVADVGVPLDRVAYLGNDVNDLACMARVGWPVAVPGAHPRVLALAKTVLHRPGGDGAVRELSERVLAARTQGDERGSERG
ncbi:MAG: acylneuraminate cytidylyltransferase [Actinomycetales bacterium]|nr:acylneuraminate cytidylyltransferase [Actinomycetales bacterium]